MILFESKKTKELKSHIANLVHIAKSDGNFSVAEKKLIFEIGEKNGLSVNDVKKIIKSDAPIDFKVPENDEQRFEELYDLVTMILADGEWHEDEIENTSEIAEKLGFRKAICSVLVRRIITLMTGDEKKSKEEIKALCADFLNFN